MTVEVADLASASRTMARSVADPLFRRVDDDLGPLFSVSGMAGDDPPARTWAAGYDRAAPAAISAAEDVVNACYRVSAMLAATARNYANAEIASTVRGHGADPAVAAAIGALPDDTRIGLPSDVPSACADPGDPDLPMGWHYVAHHVGGYLWPNGHQDRLRRAAAAWHASAAALDSFAFDATVVDIGPIVDRLPEGDDISTVCNALGEHLTAVARVHRSLGHACTQLAAHIDHAHARVRHELASLVAWTAGIQTVGAVAAVFSFGTAEVPTQAVEVERIGATVAAVAGYLGDFALAVKNLALTIGPIADAAADVRAALAWLRELRIVEVEVSAVPGLRVYSVARVEGAAGNAITVTEMSGEIGAGGRLTEEGAEGVTNFVDRTTARDALDGSLRPVSNKFFKGATSKSTGFRTIRQPDGTLRMEFFSPANNSGYGKLYVMIVNREGETLARFKDTLGPDGLIERKWIEGAP